MKLSIPILFLALPFALNAKEVDSSKASAKIDALIEKLYAPNDIKPNPLTTDEKFVRRAYLDIIGRIPTAEEAQSFLGSMEPTKRADLIDQLLDSDGYVSHQFNYWADILRITSRMNGQDPANGAAYAKWVKDAIRDNKPYDEFVSDLVTAEGMIDKNGAAGFYLRDRGMPLDHLATTVQVFLGTQMVCAQCHDHPFDEWTQMNYYELAAFSTPMDVVRNPPSITKTISMVNQESREKQNAIAGKFKKVRDKDRKNKQVQNTTRKKESNERRMIANEAKNTARGLSNLSYNFRNSVIGETQKQLKLPHDYQYNDAEPEEVINPLTPFGDKITVAEGESRIQAYGNWMTSPTNPRFTKTIANRLWKRVMGVGLFEPVDNIMEDTEATNPELMAYLEELLIDLNYDLKAYYRVLYNTNTYQREAASVDMLADYFYPGPRLRRMSAEQVWDSLITLVRPELDSASDPRAAQYGTNQARVQAWEKMNSESPEALLKRQQELATFNEDSKKRIDEMRAKVDKAISKKNQKQAVALGQQLISFNSQATKEYARLTYWDLESFGNRYFQTPFRNVPQTLYRQLKTAFPKAGFDKEREFRMPNSKNSSMMMMAEAPKSKEKDRAEQKRLRNEMGKVAYDQMMRERKATGRLKNYVRASEISSPAPDGHFLRTFGQSDRQLIENANDEASVPQSLALMNGPLFTAIGDPFAVASKQAHAAEGVGATIDSIYLSMLARKATEKEHSLLRTEFENAKNKTDAIRGIIWTVLNTQQFLFVE